MLRVESVSYETGNRLLLKDISFSIKGGEMVAILGANGAGKSTLMKILCREKQPTAGRVLFDGKDLREYSAKEMAAKRATLYQQNSVTMAFTVQEVVMMGRYGHYSSNPAERDLRAMQETMEVCGINYLADRSMLTLSGGEQQRVHLARVLAQLWDNKEALLLLDEPISGMDLQYQHQTLAIAAALASKGFMVISVLHDINLAAQYADRILMLKGGRKWWDGSPMEVLTSQHIYTAFAVHAQVETDPKTLITHVVPEGVLLNAGTFNSNMAINYNNMTLKEKYQAYQQAHPKKRILDIAKDFNISEAQLLMTGLGDQVTLLRPEMDNILKQVENLGHVMALTRNEYCVNERKGTYQNFSQTPHAALFLGEDIDLRLFLSKWKLAFSVSEGDNNSLQFFDESGNAVHKIYLTGQSDKENFIKLVAHFKAEQQAFFEIKPVLKTNRPERRDAEIDIQGFHTAWNTMKDSHEFFGLLHRFGLNRMQALRLAPEGRAMQMSLESFRRTIAHCAVNEVPVMIFTGNEGCIQIHTGSVKNLAPTGSWFNVLDPEFNLHVNEDGVSSLWHVVKPSTDGDVNSLELYNKDGEVILQVFGKRKPGIPELETWREALAGILV
ncbi:heme ABC transporter ATP-binding protein [Pedobacter metabolipauper]|uniref:Putative heme degradation protein n=1 Tax=Pedobacter metabolipauper TaxID=425513 RepID=A0A4R6STG6_9SPHI|nr:heme ABC transporter ATP-binding protein [Pedobacter metabolipauper]TDQ08246.1 putative heme degradation protein [Pedobacter metabolipauper]